MVGFTRSVTFVEDAIVKDHNGKVTESYKAGEVLETNPASAKYWINTRKAVPTPAGKAEAKPTSSTDEPQEKKAPAPKKKRAYTKKKTAPKKQAD